MARHSCLWKLTCIGWASIYVSSQIEHLVIHACWGTCVSMHVNHQPVKNIFVDRLVLYLINSIVMACMHGFFFLSLVCFLLFFLNIWFVFFVHIYSSLFLSVNSVGKVYMHRLYICEQNERGGGGSLVPGGVRSPRRVVGSRCILMAGCVLYRRKKC